MSQQHICQSCGKRESETRDGQLCRKCLKQKARHDNPICNVRFEQAGYRLRTEDDKWLFKIMREAS